MTITDELPAYLPDGVISVDADQTIVFANAGAGDIFGYSPANLLGQPLEILIPPRYRTAHRDHVERFLRADEAGRFMGQRGEIVGLRAKGAEFPAEASFFKTEHENTHYLTAVVRDITERKQRQQELVAARRAAEEANKAKDHLITSINHELRTPLNAIVGFSSMIENDIYGNIGNENYIDAARNVKDSAKHLLELVNDILTMSSLQMGQYDIHEENINLRQIVTECCMMNEPSAQTKGVELEADVSPAWHLLADPKLIRQSLVNALANAVKFTPAGGRVKISVERTAANDVALTVADTGSGIDEKDLPRVTDAFNQADTDRISTSEGIGLGLSLVKAMVESLGGQLHIESTKNVGTSLMMIFPAWRLR
ncbi:two-component system, unclassified family, sensor histidine kinase and response regulator [Limimonas halophila]|uniref:histidine kinase n=1 Tax=Limimonas halophila TaxID=1082479 RepID=A0A1G7TRB2_9PROT|nr:PAS domain-containing sensor histidine kinase [Limimonas halophila]SDG37817.1 two-component system, unclassified family, sensor histidine kinase and response regulator [Limimonas halophila]